MSMLEFYMMHRHILYARNPPLGHPSQYYCVAPKPTPVQQEVTTFHSMTLTMVEITCSEALLSLTISVELYDSA